MWRLLLFCCFSAVSLAYNNTDARQQESYLIPTWGYIVGLYLGLFLLFACLPISFCIVMAPEHDEVDNEGYIRKRPSHV